MTGREAAAAMVLGLALLPKASRVRLESEYSVIKTAILTREGQAIYGDPSNSLKEHVDQLLIRIEEEKAR